MVNQKYHKIFFITALAILLALFCYFRLTPIFFQTVPYTYDQGRDFLKAEEIARFHNLTFIGPTTGIQGVYHGAWWFYFLALAYALFNGLPQGFYLAMFFLMLVSTVGFFIFIKNQVHPLMAVLYFLIMTVSPYAIGISFFPSNNMLTPVVLMFFIYSVFMFIKTQETKYLFMTGLAIGFVFETEVAFGLFLMPSFLLTSLLFMEFRKAFLNLKKDLLFIAGLIPAFIPRMLFEIKNHFMQTRAILHFSSNPTQYNPQSLNGAIHERMAQYGHFLQVLFYGNNTLLALVFAALAILAVYFGYKKVQKNIKKSIIFFSVLPLVIFIVTLGYKNNFFWDYYLEGIQYLFLFTILLCLSLFLKNKKTSFIIISLIVFYAGINAFGFFREIAAAPKEPPTIGLRADDKTVRYIYSQVHENNFCARIYTPPIVPYTYDYLFHYYAMKNHYNTPLPDFIDKKCFVIIDKDQYPFRIVEWRQKNIPAEAHLIQKVEMHKQTTVELWSL